jgi:hypothetical protein
MRCLIVLSFCTLLLAGCIARLPPPNPTRTITIGPSLLDETFETRGDWDAYHKVGLFADVVEGSYRLETTLAQYAHILRPAQWGDVVVEAEFYLRSPTDDALYGVMCRADSDGKGYYFLISGDGAFSIRRGDENVLKPLVQWQNTSAFRPDTPRQRLRAICSGEYLALYLNDEFVGETTDDLYGHGAVGLAAAVPPRAPAGTQVQLDIDAVRVWEAK